MEHADNPYKFAFISDTHGMHNAAILNDALAEIGYVDFLIHAGDCTGHGSKSEGQQFIDWFGEQQAKHKIFIAGNHDFAFANKEKFDYPEDVHYLENTGIELDGVKFWGSPITPIFYNWAFMEDDKGQKDYFDLIPTDTNVLITHGPPLGHLDLSLHGVRCGSQALKDRVLDVEPLIHVFGHIHEGAMHGTVGEEEGLGKTTLVNASSLNARYMFRQHPVQYLECKHM